MIQALLSEIEWVIREGKVAPSRFGRDAVNDPRLVFDLRRGRRLKPANIQRVAGYLQRLKGQGDGHGTASAEH